MLWRSSYATKIERLVPVESFAVTSLTGEATNLSPRGIRLVVVGTEALGEWTLWTKLIDRDLAGYTPCETVVVHAKRGELMALIPPSRHVYTKVATDPFPPAVQGRVQAMVLADGTAAVTMTGPPTEEAWDEFVAAATDLLRRS